MQTLAQAYKYCDGQVPHRHTDAIHPCTPYLESNIIFNVEGLFYLIFPQNQALPCGYEYFCTVQEFMDFVPPVKLIDGKAYQFEHNGIVWDGIYIIGENSMWYSLSTANVAFCTNIQPLTVGVK